MQLRKILIPLALLGALGAAGLGNADDTDIYLKPVAVNRDDAPNILIVFDNSASMEDNTAGEGVGIADFDPTATYTAGGYDNTRVYYCLSGVAPGCVTATSWFNAAVNNCTSSATALGNTAAAQGYYVGKAVHWRSDDSSVRSRWATFSDVAIQPGAILNVECENDSPADSGSGNTYISKGTNINYSDRYSSLASQEINWSNIETVSLFSGNYLNYLADPPPAVLPKSRMDVARAAVKSIVSSISGVRLGVMAYNKNWNRTDATVENAPHGGRLLMKMDAMDATRRTLMAEYIDTISAHPPVPTIDLLGLTVYTGGGHVAGATSESSADTYAVLSPMLETLWEAYRYLGGLSVDYGDDDTEVIPTGATAHPERDQSAETTGPADESGAIPQIYNSPFNAQCQQVYIIIVSDFEPTLDTNASTEDRIAGLGVTDGGTGVSGTLLDDFVKYMYENDLDNTRSGAQLGVQRALTYAIGVDVAAGSAAETLMNTIAANGHGEAYSASNASALVSRLQAAIVDIQSTTASFAAPTLSVNAFNKLFNRDEVYFALFKPSATVAWEGNVKKFRLCDTGDSGCTFGEVVDSTTAPAIDPVTLRIKDSARSFWSTVDDGGNVTLGGAGAKIQTAGYSARKLFSLYPASFSTDGYANVTFPVTLSGSGSAYRVAATTGTSLYDAAVADPSILGITTVTAASDEADRIAAVTQMIEWMLGRDAFDNDNDGVTDETRWAFGDPLHSRPVAVTYGAAACTAAQVATSTHACYGRAVGSGNPDLPVIKLFIGTNDGVIRMINDSTGVEEWAFIPPEMLSVQAQLAADADADHVYGIDGTPTFWIQDNSRDADNNIVNIADGYINPADNDFMYMFIGMRRGGRNIYAFDITPTAKLTANAVGQVEPKLKWVIRGGVDASYLKLGQTWSRPQVAPIRYDCQGANANCTVAGDSEAKHVLIFGGGYDTNQDSTVNNVDGTGADSIGNAIYIVDPATGARIWWASNGADANGVSPQLTLSQMTYSIPSDLALIDSDGDGEINRLYVGDTGGQVWRIDLGTTIKVNTNGGSTGGRLADVSCSTGSRPTCTNTVVQDRRKFFYPPDMAQVKDTTFSAFPEYDAVTIVAGDRADPTDSQTEYAAGGAVEAVHNRIYVFRDYLTSSAVSSTNFPQCVSTSGGTIVKQQCTSAAPLTDSNLYDLTSNPLQDPNGASYEGTKSALKAKTGWYVDLKESSSQTTPAGSSTWVGEKGLAETVIFDGVLFATTYVPSSDATAAITCAKDEGLGRLYAMNLFSGAATIDLTLDGDVTGSDRISDLGGGIPSELVTVIREGGVTGLVGISGGTATPQIGSELPRFLTFWYQE